LLRILFDPLGVDAIESHRLFGAVPCLAVAIEQHGLAGMGALIDGEDE
jgi:hypothetical protein